MSRRNLVRHHNSMLMHSQVKNHVTYPHEFKQVQVTFLGVCGISENPPSRVAEYEEKEGESPQPPLQWGETGFARIKKSRKCFLELAYQNIRYRI